MGRSKNHALVMGLALFAMFFGAGNLIFPPFLGRASHNSYFASMIGFLLTGVGLPFLGIIAVAKSDGGIEKMGRKVFKNFGNILAIAIVLIIGPLFAIPRTCATTFELAILPNVSWMNSWIFSAIYFSVILFFSLSPSSAVERIGKYLTPALLVTLTILIIRGILKPIAAMSHSSVPYSFGNGFIEGYQTMDLIASTVMGVIILNQAKVFISDRSKQMKTVIKCGAIAALCLTFVYGGLVYIGATTAIVGGEFSRVELLVFVTNSLLGGYGKLALAILVSLACITTAVALVMLNGDYLGRAFGGKTSYKWICIVVSGVSLVISNAGVGKIIQFAAPPLIAIYPVVIVLVFLTLFEKYVKNRNLVRGAVIGAFLVGALKASFAIGLENEFLKKLYDSIPLSGFELGWITAAFIGSALGYVVGKKELSLSSEPQRGKYEVV